MLGKHCATELLPAPERMVIKKRFVTQTEEWMGIRKGEEVLGKEGPYSSVGLDTATHSGLSRRSHAYNVGSL